jgi:hypothetical protein
MFSTSMEVRLTLERQREIWSLKSELILVDDNDAIRQGVRSFLTRKSDGRSAAKLQMVNILYPKRSA